MSEKILNDIANVLSDINGNIPSEASLYDVENKLDKIIELMESQCDISERIVDRLDRIYNDMPENSDLSTHTMENHLEKISNKLSDTNTKLQDVVYNTGE